MASASRTLDTDIIQVRTVYAKTPQNNFIPSSFILISQGDGSTQWAPVSSIIKISSFNHVTGNSIGSMINADLLFDTLTISTTGVDSLFESYVDPVARVLMLRNYLPPVGVTIGSVPNVSLVAASVLPNPQFLIPSTGFSTIKFLGVNDILLSTVTDQRAIFVSISSFTSAGYSTISGETFNWRPTLYSTLSTSAGITSFVSSVGFTPSGTTGNPMSTVTGSANPRDLYFSSITFSGNHLMKYMNNNTSNTRMFVEMHPSLFFDRMTQDPDVRSLTKQIVSYIQLETPTTGRVVFNESSNVRYMTSQITTDYSSNTSNWFQAPIRMEINPYTLQSNIALNLSNNVNLTVYHVIKDGLYEGGVNSGFPGGSLTFDNRTDLKTGLYVQMMNNTQTLP